MASKHNLNEQLWHVVGPGNIAEVEALLNRGADPNYSTHDGRTAVHRACLLNCLDQLKVLIGGGGSLASTDGDRETPLHLAALKGHTAIVEFMLDLGVDAQSVSDYGTPLDRAAYGGHTTTVATLLNAGVPATTRNHWGRTPLHEACKYGRIEVARLLLKRGADVNAVDQYGNERTPLHEAVAPGDSAITELLLLYGADINHRNSWGATPLHMAARIGAYDVVEVLLLAGADPQVIDSNGRKPEDEVAGSKRTEMLKLLEAASSKTSAWFPSEVRPEFRTSSPGFALKRYEKARLILQESLPGEGYMSQEQINLQDKVLNEALQDLGIQYQPDDAQREKRNEKAHLALIGGAPYKSAQEIAADVRVLPLRSLIELDGIVRQQELLSNVKWMSPEDDPLLIIFVSHRWEHASHPDPYGTQLQTLKQFARAFLDVAIGHKQHHDMRCQRIPTLRTHGTLQAAYFVGAIAEFVDGFQGNDTQLREQLLTRVGIIYDYMSLPQKPRLKEEEAEFLIGMRNFRRLMSSINMLVLRYPDDEYGSRSWCELEFWSANGDSGTPVVLRGDKWNEELDIQNMGPPENYNSRPNYLRVLRALSAWEREEKVSSAKVARSIMADYELAFSWKEKESSTPLVVRPAFDAHNEPNISATPRSFQFWHSVRSVLCHGIENEDFAAIIKEHMALNGVYCTDAKDLVTTGLWLLGLHEFWADTAFLVFYGRCILRHLIEGKDLNVALFCRLTNERVHFKFADGEESLE